MDSPEARCLLFLEGGGRRGTGWFRDPELHVPDIMNILNFMNIDDECGANVRVSDVMDRDELQGVSV